MSTRPLAAAIEFAPTLCANHTVDMTAGCSFACLYCPFSKGNERRHGVRHPTPLDVAPVRAQPAPPTVFVSPASDPFAPQAASRTHEVLADLLARGTAVGIVTKGVIPERTLALLREHRSQVEGVAIGLSSMDDRRNRALEPGAPDTSLRLATLERVATAGLTAGLRMDPLFPDLDDGPEALAGMVDAAAARGAFGVTATYVFAYGPYLRRLRAEPVAAAACAHLTERAPMEGGTAFSVPLARKLETYATIQRLAAARGLKFNTCGCKDVRLRASTLFPTSCRNTWFLADRDAGVTRSAAPPAPAA